MKIVIAPDSFKESLGAADVAAALAEGVIGVCASASVDLCPMADGGSGTVEAMVAATGGQFLAADVYDPVGREMRARFGLLGSAVGAGLPGQVGLSAARAQADGEGTPAGGPAGLTAVLEMAAASGLALLPPDMRDPMRTTTYGTGLLIVAALDQGAGRIVLGIGDSATVDGGCGCAQALGISFLDADGRDAICGLAGGGLAQIAHIDVAGRDPRLDGVKIRIACDADNPLLGPNGAAPVYAPQKGATPEMVVELEAGLTHLANVIRRDLGVDVTTRAGGGAAGGLGAGLAAFAGATLEPGLPLVAEAVDLPRRLTDADLCITGEGRLDAQSAAGKTAAGVAEIARRKSVPVICIPGQATPDAPTHLFSDVRPLVADEVTKRLAMQQPHEILTRRAKEALRAFIASN